MPHRTVRVETNDRLLRRALVAQLRHEPHFLLLEAGDQRDGSDIVLSTTTDLTIERCQELAASGARVVVLAALPSSDERAKYEQAGASAYIPMTADGPLLLKEIREAVS